MADQFGRQAAACPSDTNEVQLWVCPAGKQLQGKLCLCNKDTVDQTFSFAHCAAGHGDNNANPEDWRAFGQDLEAGVAAPEYAIEVGPAESIRIKSGAADKINFAVSGMLMDA